MDAPFFTALLLLLAAPAVGSFLGVLVDRLPRGQSVVWPGSACRGCQRRLTARDLVPVLSYVALRGRCGSCGAAIPAWHLYLEIAATGTAVLAVLAGGPPWQMAGAAAFLWLLLALGICDMLWFRLPDALTGALAALVLALAWGTGRLEPALWGAALGAGSFEAIRRGYRAVRGRAGLGLGDVKLMAGLGAFAGPATLPLLVLLAALAALAGAAAGALATGQDLRATRALPFGAALCAATATLWLARATIGATGTAWL